MEPRRLLAADPLFVGAVYIEEDLGSDAHGDTFEITFTGGAEGTELRRLTIDGDQNSSGFGVGDVFFDTQDSGLGADHGLAFQVISMTSAHPDASVQASVADGSSLLVLQFENFHAGDRLVFAIDVDEVEYFDPAETNPMLINDGFDPITSGVEFQGSQITAEFSAPHYHDTETIATFYNRYDDNFVGTGLNLSPDNIDNKRDRTAGAVGDLQQKPLPISIAGRVYLETDLDLVQDAGEPGLAGVGLELWRQDGSDYVFTGHMTTTDLNGDYRFGLDLDLAPATYQVRESQPDGLLSVGAIPGTVGGVPVGETVDGDKDVLTGIEMPTGGQHAVDYVFAEARPARISGHVYHDRDDDGNRETGEEGIGGVEIRLIPISTIAPQSPVSVFTSADGSYAFDNLAPGSYRIVELSQPDGYLDGLDSAGTVAGVVRGVATNPGDLIDTVFVGGGESGVDYNFGEVAPASISGNVHLSLPNGDCFTEGVDYPPLAGVAITLLNEAGETIAETRTRSDGMYDFQDLRPGIYTVVESTPDGLLDGGERAGRVGNQSRGVVVDNDRVGSIVVGAGESAVDFDFCEHEPASVAGYVYHDRNNDGDRQSGEEGIDGVTVSLLDSAGRVVDSQNTTSDGAYSFEDLPAGVYNIVETHPTQWTDGLDTAGTLGGTPENPGDRIAAVDLQYGDNGLEYNFGELQLASIEGTIQLSDKFGDCFSEGIDHEPVSDVSVLLQNELGQTIAETTSDSDGHYRFGELMPGIYKVVEITPEHLIDGAERIGSINGQTVGAIFASDEISDIVLSSGQHAIDYDFCEHLPASLSGFVYHDQNNNGSFDVDESPLAGVTMSLMSSDGQVVTTVTNGAGYYEFVGLIAGEYSVSEVQPAGYLDGLDSAGNIDGTTVGMAVNPGDEINGVSLRWGDTATQYNFGELMTGSIEGFVHADLDGDCDFDADEAPLGGVRIDLLNEQGDIIATTFTDDSGFYRFDDLQPGRYSVQETQAAGYLHGGQRAGSGGGDDQTTDLIRSIDVGSGVRLVNYNFCEIPPAGISGTVHVDPNMNCEFDEGEQPLAGVTVRLLDANGDLVAETTTDASGNYRFEGLRPGTYSVVEEQPEGYFQGGARAGSGVGNLLAEDVISDILIGAGQQLVDYNFCEIPPASISGMVHVDPNMNCEFENGEQPLANVTIRLLDGNGEVVATTQTDASGQYRFEGLPPGTYSIVEEQPDGYFQGGARAGSGNGNTETNDVISGILIGAGQHLVDYNFCEIPPASIGGTVFVDPNMNCEFDFGEQALAGVTIRLLDANGQLVDVTQTDALGRYHFDGLRPGQYSIAEDQPASHFQGGARAGSGNGDLLADDMISGITIGAGQQLVGYDFCEVPGGGISGYVFQDGPAILTLDGEPPADIREFRDGTRTPDDTPIAGVVLELRDGSTGEPIDADVALPGFYGDGPIRTVTDENGYYEFSGLPRGNYAVFQIHPDQYIDGIDTPGSTAGLAINQGEDLSAVVQNLSVDPAFDAIIQIQLPAAGISENNNFSEVAVDRMTWFPPSPAIIVTPTPAPIAPPVAAPVTSFIAPPPLIPVSYATYGSSGGVDFSWHLSIVDGGAPRGEGNDVPVEGLVWRRVSWLDSKQWREHQLDNGRWTTRGTSDEASTHAGKSREFNFGIRGGTPVVGDFNGDGISEVGVYYNGHWFIDLNGNGRWDEGDLWAKLGTDVDIPVTGDWNGDGKDDIGIFGPAWEGDPRAIEVEPGLPDSENTHRPLAKPKNMPPKADEATNGRRLLRNSVYGTLRADMIDHVFNYGADGEIPITGDWTGDGIETVGVFDEGQWRLDLDGDGRFTKNDRSVPFGQRGDIPVVGDFDGDGIDDLGLYRAGQWMIDLDGNQQIDSHDKVFEMGGSEDVPVVGDFDGDGVDDPGVYRDAA